MQTKSRKQRKRPRQALISILAVGALVFAGWIAGVHALGHAGDERTDGCAVCRFAQTTPMALTAVRIAPDVPPTSRTQLSIPARRPQRFPPGSTFARGPPGPRTDLPRCGQI